MDANAWKLSVTGTNCPSWCTADHSGEDARLDSVIHLSGAAAVAFPPLVSGERLTAAFTTCASETFQEQRRQTRIDFGVHDQNENDVFRDYVPVRTRAELDGVLADLDRVAEQLRVWRERLPKDPGA
ncbi:DUF6907 domain-containing protein [Streptomyces scopuliridis]|uniref:DUF6907 domain-containing protein n=1 Tax=Streptomyces scopuliridis TaxID=452529 RepID=UPI0036822986